MTTLANLGFEDAGASAGLALDWVAAETITAERLAVFGTDDPPLDEEGFEEEWVTGYLFDFDPLVDILGALFDASIGAGESYEDFTEGWGSYLFELASSGTALFDSGAHDTEDFENGWGNDAYLETFVVADFAVDADSFDTPRGISVNVTPGAATISTSSPGSFPATASFMVLLDDGLGHTEYVEVLLRVGAVMTLATPVVGSYSSATGTITLVTAGDLVRETFSATRWPIGTTYHTTLDSVDTAAFDGANVDQFEDFEETFTDLALTAVAATDLLSTGSAHGLSAGDLVTFVLVGVGALPAGLDPGFVYHVIASGLTATAFKVSTTSGGSAVDLTDAGAGSFFVRGDPSLYWLLTP